MSTAVLADTERRHSGSHRDMSPRDSIVTHAWSTKKTMVQSAMVHRKLRYVTFDTFEVTLIKWIWENTFFRSSWHLRILTNAKVECVVKK